MAAFGFYESAVICALMVAMFRITGLHGGEAGMGNVKLDTR
jgi:hypothetical protein